MNEITEAVTDSTPDDSVAPVGQTEEALLADIVANSAFTQSLPNEQIPEPDPEESDSEDPESEDVDSEEVEEEVEDEEVDTEEDDAEEEVDSESATNEPDVFATEDLDLDAKVVVKIDGEFAEVSFGDLIKGYSTEQHLSKQGRELGEARKEMEEEYQAKVEEIATMSKASAAVLYSNEQGLAKEYHELEAKIEKAREEDDTYEMGNLKDKREQVQKKYWEARNQREGLVKVITEQEQEMQEAAWKEQLQYFDEQIPTMIPDFNEEVAGKIREFAIEEGIAPEILDTIADPVIVKFVDDYRRLKQGITKGEAKRKKATAKKVPIRKQATPEKKKLDRAAQTRARALSGDATPEEQQAFLRGLAERSLNL